MAVRLLLPRLVGSREAADDLLEALGDVEGADVEVDCSELLTASPSFADQLIESALVRRGVRRLLLRAAPPSFDAEIGKAAARHGVTHQLASLQSSGR